MNLTQALRIGYRDVVSLVGGGGKSTALTRLASELAGEERRVVTMTTTNIARCEAEQFVCYELPPVGGVLDELESLLTRHLHVMVLGSRAGRSNSVSMGVTMEEAVRVSGLPFVDNTIIEADGARMLSFKAPAGHEPVVPSTTTVVVPVVGLDVLGRPLTDESVHRPELVAKLCGVGTHTDVTAEVVASVLAHPQGGLKGVPPGARVVPLVNKIDGGRTIGSPESLAQARVLADRLLDCCHIDHVVLGSLRPAGRAGEHPLASSSDPVLEVRTRVAAVILAAGGASRYGQLKQLLPWGTGTLLSQVVDTVLASKARPVVVVLGNQAQACLQAMGDRPVEIVVNELWSQGQSTSVRAGLATLPDNVSAAMFPLADAPMLTVATIDALIERYWRTFAPVVWPEHEGKRGNPVLFDRALFSQLNQLTEDTGGRSVLKSYSDQAERVSVPDVGILKDIDTPQDYEAYR